MSNADELDIQDEAAEVALTLGENSDTETLLNPLGKNEYGLMPKQEEFCQYYTSLDRDMFGNGTECYLEAYGEDYMEEHNGRPMKRKVAAVLAYKLLKIPHIINRISMLLEEGGFNENNVDKHHLFLINQFSDLKTKLGAIKEFNSLKKRTEQPITGNNFYAIIQNIIHEPKGHIIEGRVSEVKREVAGQGMEIEQPLSHSEQGRGESPVQIEQATDLLTSQPPLQEFHS